MSLSRQLLVIILILFLVAFAGTLFISINSTRSYLEEQLQSHAQDTATSLALSLVPPLTAQDQATVETMVDAVFDRGYYKDLAIVSLDGSVLLKRTLPVRSETVPKWFTRLIPLETPQGEAVLTAGWRQAGKVMIRSHPGYAYNRLWKSTIVSFGWFAGLWTVAGALLVITLRYLLAPLREVEQQALAISNREFAILEKVPMTKELRSVVVAMNKMSAKMRDFIADQSALTEKIRDEAYRDPVTGLANRRQFELRLEHILSKPDEFPHGTLLLIQLADFKGYNDRHGYIPGDELLAHAARLIEKVCGDEGNNVIARLNGADFAVVIPGASATAAETFGETITGELAQLQTRGLIDQGRIGHVGIAYYETVVSASDLISQADMALRAAQSKGPTAWHLYDKALLDRRAVPGRMQWQETVKNSLINGEVTLLYQPVVSSSTRAILHYEALARIPGKDGALFPAGLFISMAERMGLALDFDKLVVTKVLAHLRARPQSDDTIAVNLSPASVHDTAFTDWLCGLLQESPDLRHRMLFESGEFGCAAKPESLRRFVDRLRAAGGKFSLDHFGLSPGSFGYMRETKLDYIKIDGSFIRRLHDNKDNQFFVHALAEIAHGLDIHVIAESVESQQEWDALKDLRIDGIQGYVIGEPRTKD